MESGDRHLFLLLSPEGRIVGETALTDIDTQLRSANFRMAIFQPGLRGKGLDTWAARATRDFAFAELKLHRLELDVFSFNPRAERCYRKAGFRREGVRRDAVVDSATGAYGDDILMALLEEEWKAVKQNET